MSATAPLTARLVQRRAELHALLQEAAGAAVSSAGDSHEVQDFKDVAAQESRTAVDEVALAHAHQELAQITLALRRVEDGSYGVCLDCGEAIDARRLLALPATALCTGCQARRERPGHRR